jgi:CheY-like chemotaxis protein
MARILVVDDDELVRNTIWVMLRSQEHDAEMAADGEKGVAQFLARPFDLVICDLFMPNKDGLETIKEMHRLSPATPIIAISGGAAPGADGAAVDPDFLRMAGALGATAMLPKPFGLEQMTALVERCLARSAAAALPADKAFTTEDTEKDSKPPMNADERR